MASLKSIFDQISAHFHKIIGPNAVEDLVNAISGKKVIVISGEMYTGKDTQIDRLASAIGAEKKSAGGIFREIAKSQGKEPAVLGAELMDPTKAAAFEPKIDYATCKAIAEGSKDHKYMIVQGRLAVWMAEYMRSLGKTDICTLIFTCDPKEQALRMVTR